MTGTFSGNYPIETRAGEIERLHVQSKAMAPDALAMLDRFGPMQGWTCLDIGCGPGGCGAAVQQNIIPPPPACRARIATARRR